MVILFNKSKGLFKFRCSVVTQMWVSQIWMVNASYPVYLEQTLLYFQKCEVFFIDKVLSEDERCYSDRAILRI